jgi:uncharacterized membrane protein
MQTTLPIRSFAIGAATGLRTMSGPAAVAGRAGWGRVLPLLALGELIVDKLPQTPLRTMPAGLAARAIAGAFAGRAVAVAAGKNGVAGTVAGVAGAIAAAYAGAAYRGAASRYVPPFLCALLEDGVSIVVARAAAAPA